MGITDRFLWTKKKPGFERANPNSGGTLVFRSILTMEKFLDGSEDRFNEFYFAIYHCSPDDHKSGGINERRVQLRNQFPDKAISVGERFILQGEPAWRALSAYYQALINCETLSDEFRAYARERLEECTKVHRQSQSLPVPMDLTEGQLARDLRLEYLTCVALGNGQVFLQGT